VLKYLFRIFYNKNNNDFVKHSFFRPGKQQMTSQSVLMMAGLTKRMLRSPLYTPPLRTYIHATKNPEPEKIKQNFNKLAGGNNLFQG